MNELLEKTIDLFKDSVDDCHSSLSEFNPYSRQARACFTAWAIVNNVDVDTSTCDEATAYIYSQCFHNTSVSRNDFENYLYEDIV